MKRGIRENIFIGQNWIVVISTVVAIICCYLIIQSEEKKNLEKLDNEYEDYKKKVPKLNFLLGIIKSIQSKRQKDNRN